MLPNPRRHHRPLFASLGLAALGLAAVHPAFAQTAVLTQNNDNARTGSNTAETVLTPANVTAAKFGKLFTITGLNANVNGQVLYVPGVAINGAKRNVVYAYTSNNADNSPCGVYAYDGDTGTQLWKTVLPPSATYTTATPVIDPATNTMYVLTKTGTDNTGLTYLHAFDITTGLDRPGSPIQVSASASGTGDGSDGGKVYFDGDHGAGRFHANDRVGLLFSNGQVYTAFAHNSDSFPYHGWVLAYKYDGAAFTQTAVFCTTPNGGDGGIWQAGKGLTADASGNIYFSIGNGTFDASSGGADYGMCYMKLSPSLQVLDWFAPFDEQGLSNQDLDLGNSGLAGIPGTTALFGGGTKFGTAFLLDSNNLGKFTPNGPDKSLARINNVSGDDQIGQNPIAWDSGTFKYVYLWPSGQPMEQFKYDPAVGNLSPKGIFATAPGGVTNGGSLAVSSNGTSSAILWAYGDDGTVRAYDATNVAAAELWDSKQNSSRDSIGHSGHFQFPTVVNGKVYVPTGGASIAVYGLLQATPPPPPPGILGATQARFAPRPSLESRMVGGKFQGSTDGATYTDLATIASVPPAGSLTTLTFARPAAYRYLRYLAPDGAYGNIAELEFDSGTGASVAKISGTPFGTPGSWRNQGNGLTKAFDGNTYTFFDAPDPGVGDFVGIDQAAPATQVRFAPRPGFEARMIGGKFQGSADGATYTDLATVTSAPPANQYTTLTFAQPAAYRYLRYLGPNGSYGNIAEIEFDSGTGANVAKIVGTPFGTPGSYQNSGNDITKVFDGNTYTFFDAPLYPGNGDFVGIK